MIDINDLNEDIAALIFDTCIGGDGEICLSSESWAANDNGEEDVYEL